MGLQNFAKLFRDSGFRISVKNTLYYAVFTVPLTMVASLLIAVLLNSKIRGIVVYRTAFFFPYVASLVAVGAVWNKMCIRDSPLGLAFPERIKLNIFRSIIKPEIQKRNTASNEFPAFQFCAPDSRQAVQALRYTPFPVTRFAMHGKGKKRRFAPLSSGFL